MDREQCQEDKICVLMRLRKRKSGSLIYISSWSNSLFVLLTSSVPGVETLITPPSCATGEAGAVPVGAAGAQRASHSCQEQQHLAGHFPASQASLPAFTGSSNCPKASARVSSSYFCVGRQEKTNICNPIFGHPQPKESAGVWTFPASGKSLNCL